MHVRRTLSFSAIPTILEDIWLPGNAFKGLTAEQMSNYQGPTYAMFELDYGVRMVRADEKIRAVLPDAEQHDAMNVASVVRQAIERAGIATDEMPMVTATIGVRPLIRAAATAQRPMPPTPKTAMLWPGRGAAVLKTAPRPVGTAQPIKAATLRSKPSGTPVRRFSLTTACRPNVVTAPALT